MVVVPFTAGFMRVEIGGSVEARMPYVVSMQGNASAHFGYGLGEITVEIDVVRGEASFHKKDFEADLDIDISASVNTRLALEFAGAANIGFCLGPPGESMPGACITINMDISHATAVGYDAAAAISGSPNLIAMYSDRVQYDEPDDCEGAIAIAAGFWEYIEIPSVKVSLAFEGAVGCIASGDNVLLDYKGGVLQKLVKSFCVNSRRLLRG